MLTPNITAAHPGWRYEIQTVGKSDLQFIQFHEFRPVLRARQQGYTLDETDFPDPNALITINDGITTEDLLNVLIDRHQALNQWHTLDTPLPEGQTKGLAPVPRLQALFIQHLQQALLCLETDVLNASVVTNQA